MDSRQPRGGRVIEELGTYDPLVKEKDSRVILKVERVQHWLSVGALPTEKTAALLTRNGVVMPKKKPRAPKPKPKQPAEE